LHQCGGRQVFGRFYLQGGDGFIKEVKGCPHLPTNKIFFNPGKGEKGVFGNIDLPFRMLALKIDYR